MRKFFRFFWFCLRDAWRGCWTRAYEMAGLLGGTILWIALWLLSPYLRKMGLIEAPSTLWGNAGLNVAFAFASLLLAFTIIYFFRLITAPSRLYWAERGKSDDDSFIRVREDILLESKKVKWEDGSYSDFCETTFYLPVYNGLRDGKTLRRVQARLFFVGEPTLCRVKESGTTDVDLRHGEIAFFEIGSIVTEEKKFIGGLMAGDVVVPNRLKSAYEHNVKKGHVQFSVSKHGNFGNMIDGAPHVWRLVMVLSADDSLAKHVPLDVCVDTVKPSVSHAGAA